MLVKTKCLLLNKKYIILDKIKSCINETLHWSPAFRLNSVPRYLDKYRNVQVHIDSGNWVKNSRATHQELNRYAIQCMNCMMLFNVRITSAVGSAQTSQSIVQSINQSNTNFNF